MDWMWVDVVRTTLDTREKDKYRIEVFGRLFVRNLTDVLRLYLDTNKSNRGPEFAISWFLGRSPAGHVGQVFLNRTTDWEKFGARKHCAISKSAAYVQDRLTLMVPRKCLGNPDKVRWAGYVGDIVRVTRTALRGYWDDFPGVERLPNFWAGGDQARLLRWVDVGAGEPTLRIHSRARG